MRPGQTPRSNGDHAIRKTGYCRDAYGNRLCGVETCGRQSNGGSQDLCAGHEKRWSRHGDVLAEVPLRVYRRRQA